MGSEDNEFRFESLQDSESIAKYLEALKEGFSNGRILLGNQQKKMILEPDGLLKFDVKAKRKRDKIKLSIICTWKESGEERKPNDEALTIETTNGN